VEVRFVAPDLRRIDEIRADALALPLFQDERPPRGTLGLIDWRLCGQVSRLLVRGLARGVPGEVVLMPTRSRLSFERLFLFGVGAPTQPDPRSYGDSLEHMLRTLARARVRSVVLALPNRRAGAMSAADALDAFLSRASAYPEQDQFTLIEPADDQRAMSTALERYKRRLRIDDP
jgi:hypothetical protein